jgi:hypothetical protein
MFFYPRKPPNMQYLVAPSSKGHKILGLARKLTTGTGIALCLGIFGLLQAHKAQFILLPDGVHFVDADCYSRMTRARIISEKPGTVITRHLFENYPYSVRPHTTAPMDYLIVGFGRLLGGGVNLDIAGAWISPALGALLILVAGLWAQAKTIRYPWSMMALLSISPVILHGFAVGRPDHQSLILLLVASGLMAETVLWTNQSKPTSLWWGFSWGCALWVSWFEPLLLLAIVLVVRLAVWRTQCLARTWIPSLIAAAVIVAIAILLEGPPRAGLEQTSVASFWHWGGRIGELQAFNPLSAAVAWIGWLSLAVPFALAWIAYKRIEKICWLWLVLLLSTGALTGWHVRWGYFLALSGALAMPFALTVVRQRWLGYALFAARFFTSQDGEEAKLILRARHADFVVVCDADRLLDNSYTVLGQTSEPSHQLAVTLFRTPSRSPNYLHLVFQNSYFKVYQVDKRMLE